MLFSDLESNFVFEPEKKMVLSAHVHYSLRTLILLSTLLIVLSLCIFVIKKIHERDVYDRGVLIKQLFESHSFELMDAVNGAIIYTLLLFGSVCAVYKLGLFLYSEYQEYLKSDQELAQLERLYKQSKTKDQHLLSFLSNDLPSQSSSTADSARKELVNLDARLKRDYGDRITTHSQEQGSRYSTDKKFLIQKRTLNAFRALTESFLAAVAISVFFLLISKLFNVTTRGSRNAKTAFLLLKRYLDSKRSYLQSVRKSILDLEQEDFSLLWDFIKAPRCVDQAFKASLCGDLLRVNERTFFCCKVNTLCLTVFKT